MKSNTVYLHIGATKSGSTWLQRRLSNIRGELHKAGVQYPGKEIDHYAAVISLLGIAFGYDETADKESPDVWNTLAKQVRNWPNTSIISHEMLSWATQEDVKQCLESLAPRHIEVIYTLRDLGRVLPSHWQEDVKNNCKADFLKWLSMLQEPDTPNGYARNFWRFQDPSKALRSWCSFIEPEHVHVILVPHASTSNDSLWDRFAHVVGIDPYLGVGDSLFRNTSMSWSEAEVIRRLNVGLHEKLQWEDYHRMVKWLLANRVYGSRRRDDDISITLPQRYVEWVHSNAEKQKEYLLESGVHIVGNLEDLDPIITNTGSSEGPSEKQIALAAIDGLSAIIRELSSGRSKLVAGSDKSRKRPVTGTENNSLYADSYMRHIGDYIRRARKKLFR